MWHWIEQSDMTSNCLPFQFLASIRHFLYIFLSPHQVVNTMMSFDKCFFVLVFFFFCGVVFFGFFNLMAWTLEMKEMNKLFAFRIFFFVPFSRFILSLLFSHVWITKILLPIFLYILFYFLNLFIVKPECCIYFI